jgi:hypothetical protein
VPPLCRTLLAHFIKKNPDPIPERRPIRTPYPVKMNYIVQLEKIAEKHYPLANKSCATERRIMARMRQRYVHRMLDRLFSEAGYVMTNKPTQ